MASFLVVLSGSVAKAPQGLSNPKSKGGTTGGFVEVDRFRSSSNKIIAITFANGEGFMLYTSKKLTGGSPGISRYHVPRAINFAVTSDLFCLFRGYLGNFAKLKKYYPLEKNANEATATIEVYRAARDIGAFPISTSMRHLEGRYAFVLYDSSTKRAFIATDEDGTIPFFWGVDPEGNMVISDGADIVRRACGGSSSVFPKGCFYTSTKGLRPSDKPLQKLKAVQRYDDKGRVCGIDYEVDEILKGIPHVTSDTKFTDF